MMNVHDLVRDVCKHLPGWKYLADKSSDPDGVPYSGCAHAGSGDKQIMFDVRSYGVKAGHVQMRGILPSRDVNRHYVHGPNTPEIGCNSARGGEVIAKEITRRLIPGLNDAHAAAVKAVDETNAHIRGVAKLRGKIIANGRGRASGYDENKFSLNCNNMEGWCSGKVSSPESVTLELHSLAPDLALKIVKLIDRAKKKPAATE